MTDDLLKTVRPTGTRFRLTDTVVRGLSMDVGITGSMTWQFRAPMKVGHRQGWIPIGPYPGISPEAARTEARRLCSDSLAAIDLRKARRAARKAGTMEFLIGRWLSEYVQKNLALGTYRSYYEKANLYILPAFKKKLPRDITPEMVVEWHDKITRMGVAAFRPDEPEIAPSGPKVGRRKPRKGRQAATAADGAKAVLSAFFRWAVAGGKASFNPTLGTKKNGGRKIHRPMDPQARKKVGNTLMSMEANQEANVIYLEAVRFAMVTGIRRTSVAKLEWIDIDFENGIATLEDKTFRRKGPQTYPLGPAAISILQGIPRIADSPFVFPGRDPMQHVAPGTLNHIWEQVREQAGVYSPKPEKDRYGELIEKPQVRFHDLRHGKGAALGKKHKNAMVAAVLRLHTDKMADRYGVPIDEDVVKANRDIERELAADLAIPWPTPQRRAKRGAEVKAPAPAQIVIQIGSWPPRAPRAKKPVVKKDPKPRPTKIQWPSDEDLQRLVLEKPMAELAEQFGVSDRAIAKRCDLRGLERPPHGHWLKRDDQD